MPPVARSLLLRAALTVCLLSLASDALADTTRPAGTRPNATRLRALGIAVTWPVPHASATVTPGSRLVVRIRRTGRHRATALKLELTEVSPTGRTLRRLAARSLRSGTFVAQIPRALGNHYALTLRAGRLRYRTWLDTPPTTPPPAKPPLPLPPAPFPRCDTAPETGATMTFTNASASIDSQVTYTVTNTGTTHSLILFPGYTWEESINNTWVPIPSPPEATFGIIAHGASPGASVSGTAFVWGTLPSGHYRLVPRADVVCSVEPLRLGALTISAEIDIVSPIA